MYSYDEPADSFETNLFKDELTDSKIHKHLNDESDRIEESDIANIQTGAAITGPENSAIARAAVDELPKEDREKIEEPIKDNSDPEIQTSWNVLE